MNYLNGFLLSYIKYGDHDAVLHCFTREKGYQSFFVRGIYSQKNKKKAYLLPLNELGLTLTPNIRGNSLQSISKIDLLEYPEFHQDVKANSMVFFVSDFLNQILRNEDQHEQIYDEILRFLDELEKKNYSAHLVFFIRILKSQGLLPLVTAGTFLDPESGTFGEEPHHHLFGADISRLWKMLILQENPYHIILNPNDRKNLLDTILVYYYYHFAGFRTPNSLEIVKQIFE